MTGLDANRALLERHVLVFERRQLDNAQFERLASYFGSVFRSPANVPVQGSDPYSGNTPDIVHVSNLAGGVLGHDELARRLARQLMSLICTQIANDW